MQKNCSANLKIAGKSVKALITIKLPYKRVKFSLLNRAIRNLVTFLVFESRSLLEQVTQNTNWQIQTQTFPENQ